MNTSKKILFFGTDDFSVSALRHLIEAGYSIAAVITKPDSRSGRGQKLTAPAVKTLAEAHHIPVWQPTKLLDLTDDITALQPVIGVLSSYGRIIPDAIIHLFQPGIINVHPSLLPLYRGPSPVEAAIYNGDTKTGVTIMQLVAAMDAGPVYAQRTYALDGTETQPSLTESLADVGSKLLLETLPAIMDATLLPTEQIGEPTYCHLLQKSDAIVDPQQWNVAALEQKIRAHLSFPKTKLTIAGQLVTVTKARIAAGDESGIRTECKDGALIIESLIGPSGRHMSGQAFLNGYAAG